MKTVRAGRGHTFFTRRNGEDFRISRFPGSYQPRCGLRNSYSDRPTLTDAFSASGNGVANMYSEQDSSQRSKSNSDVRVEWTPWRLTHSQFRYRGTPNLIDLGEILLRLYVPIFLTFS